MTTQACLPDSANSITRAEITQALTSIGASRSEANETIAFHIASSINLGVEAQAAARRRDSIDYKAENNLRFARALLAIHNHTP